MGYGLENAGGLASAQAGLRQRLMDQIRQRKDEQDMQIQLREQALREQEAQQRNELMKQAQEDRQLALKERTQTANVGEATRLAPQLPMDQNMAPEAASVLRQGGMGGQVYTPPTMADTESGKPFDPQTANPAMNLGTAPQQATAAKSQILGRLITSMPAGSRERQALEYQQATGDAPPSAMFDKQTNTGTVHDTANGLVRIGQDNSITPLGIKGYHPPANSGDKLVKVEHKDPATGRTVIEWLPQSEVRGKTFEKGAGAATDSRLASAQAVTQTGDDIVASLSQPGVSGTLGPQLGRYNSVRDFIGDPPPEFAELAGKIESYAIANMGVHGMRSAQGAEKIKALLDKHHTPESLAATIKGLNAFSEHFMENEGRKPAATSSTKRTRYDMNGNPIK